MSSCAARLLLLLFSQQRQKAEVKVSHKLDLRSYVLVLIDAD